MQAAIDVPVTWEDREFFYIENPKDDTIDRIRKFLQEYPKK
jgi:hypothetical protein